MTSSWAKVAVGARMVAGAVANLTKEEATIAAQRATNHGLELGSRARQTAATSQDIWMKNMNGAMDMNGPPRKNNPYESQLRKQQESKDDSSMKYTEMKSPKDMPNPYLLHAEQPSENVSSSTSAKEDDEAKSTTPLHDPIAEGSSSQIHPPNDVPRLKEGQAVPSSRIGRAVGFASLGAGLALGTVSELASRVVGSTNSNGGSVVASDRNADRLAATLCRMRGAALKMGQMLSIQDETLLPPALVRALKQVRQGADAMPHHQLIQQMDSQFGMDWRDKFESFDQLPFAAASIGQVHSATILDTDGNEKEVVVKVQYPGVANSIESDLRNLTMLVTMTGLSPKGLFVENVIRVGRDELKVECNYINEMANQRAFQELVSSDPVLQANKFVVPSVIEDLTTEQIIVSEYAPGGTIDKVQHLDQEERDRIGKAILYLTMRELFDWRLMQTDPNWGNFLYDVGSGQTTLIDFGATREFDKEFVDGYLRIVWASANRDEATLMEQSRRMGFLTGEENDIMLHAHKMSGFTVGEPFWSNEKFDFQGSHISTRMGEHTSVFLKHRLTPPPEEVYTLHRKLAGAYMLCIKLGAVIECRDLLEDVVRIHNFEDGLPHPIHG